MTSCSATPIKEKKFGVAVCRERKCPDLQKDPKWPDSPQQCVITHGMPGSMSCCIKEMDADHFIRHISGQLNNGPYTSRPGPRNCPGECPYKILVDGTKFVFEKGKPESSKVPAKIGTCAFTGKPLGDWGVCPCNVLGNNKFQESQILQIKAAIERCRDVSRDAFESGHACGGNSCPDGIQRCENKGMTSCPLIRVPFKDLKVCPLWRIPAKILPEQEAKKRVDDAQREMETTLHKRQKNPPVRNCSLKECLEKVCADVVEKDYPGTRCGNPIRICRTLGKTPQNIHRPDCPRHLYDDQPASDTKVSGIPVSRPEKVAQKDKPASRNLTRKEKKKPEDPICEACRERFKGPVPDHACAWCREEQEKRGRRAWTSKLNLQVLHLGDMKKLGEEIPDESVDVIVTDPPYPAALWEDAYDNLGDLAARVLKPSGFLFTYAPHHHLEKIMDLLTIHMLSYFWIMASLNEGQTAKNHKRNVLCLFKPILVYQKAPEKGARTCFADVIKGRRQKAYHPWQQSIHDVLRILLRVCREGDIILDPYAGTGTSLIAANLLGLQWIGCEIDPKTHAIAIRELQQRPLTLFSFDDDDDIGACKTCSIECPDDNDGCKEFQDFAEKSLQSSSAVSTKQPAAPVKPVCDMMQRMHCGPEDRTACEKSGKATLMVICPVPNGKGPAGRGEIGSPEWIANIQEGQRAAHPDWVWELWQIGHPNDPAYEHLWEICPTEAAAKSLKRQLEKDPDPKVPPRKWEIRKRSDVVKKPEKAPAKKPATRKQKEPETSDPLKRFLNEHYEQIITGKDLPIVPHARELYDDMEEAGLRPLKLYLSAKEDPKIDRWTWWTLSPSGKIRKVKGPSGGHHCSVSDPACKFMFEWHYANEKKGDD
jgi:hypothetical protein